MIVAYYDLDKSPPTYDIVAFLSVVEQERIKRQEDGGRIVFVPGTRHGFRNDRFWPFTTEGRQHMLDHVAMPMARMLPGFTVEMGVRQPASPVRGSVGYGRPMYGLALHVAALRAGIRPLRASRPHHRTAPKLVTITLREAEHWPARNSDVRAWLESAVTIRERGFEVAIIRDTLQAETRFGELPTAPQASRDLECRAQLYGSAVCNLFVNNGPAWMAMALDAPVLMFKPTVENINRSCSAAYFRDCGIPPGGQIPGAPSYQRIVWAQDSADIIVREFDQFVQSRLREAG